MVFQGPKRSGRSRHGKTRLRDEDDRVQETPIGQLCWPPGSVTLGRKQMFKSDPVSSGQLVSVHHNGRSRDDLPVDPSAPTDHSASGFSGQPNFGMSEFADTP